MSTPPANEIKQIVEKEVARQIGFTARKLTDTPTDDLQVVNRKYVNLNGTLANRPNASVATMGQSYFATDTNIPMTFNSTTQRWYNGVGSVVAGP